MLEYEDISNAQPEDLDLNINLLNLKKKKIVKLSKSLINVVLTPKTTTLSDNTITACPDRAVATTHDTRVMTSVLLLRTETLIT